MTFSRLLLVLLTAYSAPVQGFTFSQQKHQHQYASSSTQRSMTVQEVDADKVVKVGVIGMGRIGLVHLEAITKAPGVTPVIVSNPTIAKAEAGMPKGISSGYSGISSGLSLDPLNLFSNTICPCFSFLYRCSSFFLPVRLFFLISRQTVQYSPFFCRRGRCH